MKENSIFGLSTVFAYPHYGSGVARVLNRNFILPSHRKLSTLDGEMPFSYVMAKHQVEFIGEELEFVFVSMEYPKHNLIKAWEEGARRCMNLPWAGSNKLYLVCPEAASAKCWQHVTYLDLSGQGRPLPLPSIHDAI